MTGFVAGADRAPWPADGLKARVATINPPTPTRFIAEGSATRPVEQLKKNFTPPQRLQRLDGEQRFRCRSARPVATTINAIISRNTLDQLGE